MMDFFHFGTWQNQARAVTKTFVPTPESDVIFEYIRQHLDWSRKPTTPRLTVSGDAGVDKSRTVLEAIAALPKIAPLTLYMDDENNALAVARAIANYQNLYAVLVADECQDATAFQLAKILQGTQQRVRLITIDNALERMNSSDLRLSRIGTATVEKIVETNFPDIDPGRRSNSHLASSTSLVQGKGKSFSLLGCSPDFPQISRLPLQPHPPKSQIFTDRWRSLGC